MIVRRLQRLMVCLLLMATSIGAATHALDLTDLGVSADSIAAGGIGGLTKSAQGIFVNPAMLGTDYNWSIDMFRAQLLPGSPVQTLSISKSLGAKHSIGAGYIATMMNRIPETQKTAGNDWFIEQVNEYNYQLGSAYVGVNSYIAKGFYLGGTLKYRHSKIYDVMGKGINADIGAVYHTGLRQISLSAHNIIRAAEISYSNDAAESFPLKITSQLSQTFRIGTAHAKAQWFNDKPLLWGLGLSLHHDTLPYIRVLAGYRTIHEYNDHVAGRFTMGMTLAVKGVSFSYAYERNQNKVYNDAHYFSITVGQKL